MSAAVNASISAVSAGVTAPVVLFPPDTAEEKKTVCTDTSAATSQQVLLTTEQATMKNTATATESVPHLKTFPLLRWLACRLAIVLTGHCMQLQTSDYLCKPCMLQTSAGSGSLGGD